MPVWLINLCIASNVQWSGEAKQCGLKKVITHVIDQLLEQLTEPVSGAALQLKMDRVHGEKLYIY